MRISETIAKFRMADNEGILTAQFRSVTGKSSTVQHSYAAFAHFNQSYQQINFVGEMNVWMFFCRF